MMVGKLPYVEGVDVSANNGVIHWPQVRAAGIRFAFVKVTEGDWSDPKAKANAIGAKRAGVLVGAYCFLSPKPGRTGAQEFDLFHAQAKACGLLSAGCLRPVVDVESTKLTTPLATRRYVYSWINRCEAVTGMKPFVYTGSWFWDGVMQARNPHGCPLWLAAYTSKWKALIPARFRGVSIHQYTDKGRILGIAGRVDRDVYLSTYRHLVNRHTIKAGLR